MSTKNANANKVDYENYSKETTYPFPETSIPEPDPPTWDTGVQAKGLSDAQVWNDLSEARIEGTIRRLAAQASELQATVFSDYAKHALQVIKDLREQNAFLTKLQNKDSKKLHLQRKAQQTLVDIDQLTVDLGAHIAQLQDIARDIKEMQ